MANSGTINGTASNSRYSLTCEWTATQNTNANTSTITAKVYLNGNGYSTQSSNWSCVINGTTVTSRMSATVSGKTQLGTRTWTVNHDSNGNCTTNISFSYKNTVSDGTYTTNNGSGSANVTLNSIARGSNISFNRSSATIGSDSITVNIARSSNSYTHKVQLFFGSYSTLLAENVATSYTFTPHMDLCNQIPNATSGTATIKVQTMNGSTWISESSKTITLNVPSSVVPTVDISLTANNQLNSANIAGRTTFTVKPTNAKGSYGSTIKSYSTVGQGLSTNSSSGGTSSTMNSGTYTYTVTVTDSRGRTANASQQVTVLNHESPTLSLIAYRSDSNGNKEPEGTYIHGDMTWSIFNPNNNNQNAKQYRVLKKTQNSATWSVVKDWSNLSSYSGTMKVSFGSGYSISTSYNVAIELKDSYSNVGATQAIGTVSCLFNIEKDGVGIGKRWEQGALDVAGQIYVTDDIFMNNANGNLSGIHIFINGQYYDMIRQARHSGVDVGDQHLHTAICSSDVPTWWDGNSGYAIYTKKNKPTAYEVGAMSSTSPLASGTWFMDSHQTVRFTKKISECQHGICLQWQDYANGTANAKDFVYTFIPKAHSARNDGKPLSVLLPIYEQGNGAITKWIYVYDGKITGYSTNSSASNAQMVVLTAVYEV